VKVKAVFRVHRVGQVNLIAASVATQAVVRPDALLQFIYPLF
jgi:hypothetical protein